MKKLFSIAAILIFSIAAQSQSDTLYTKKQQKIVCKIIEVNEFDFKYQLSGLQEGPTYVINRDKIIKYTLYNGYTEIIVPDELLVDGEHNEILSNRSVIKTHPFSLVNNQISMAYEKVIKVGMNLDVEVGYINNSMNKNPIFAGSQVFYNNSNSYPYYNSTPAFYTGAYIKPGIKFFLGHDFSAKGLRYAHPLKGRFFRFDLALSYLNYQNVTRLDYSQSGLGTVVTTNVSAFSYGGIINYGRQFILANIFTLEYYLGVGFTGLSYTYSNPEYAPVSSNNYYSYDEASNLSNFHGFLRVPGVGLTGSLGLRVGYILPDKSMRDKKHAPIN